MPTDSGSPHVYSQVGQRQEDCAHLELSQGGLSQQRDVGSGQKGNWRLSSDFQFPLQWSHVDSVGTSQLELGILLLSLSSRHVALSDNRPP